MSSFSALKALAQQNTQSANVALQQTLDARKRKEEEERRAQVEREKREAALEARLRQKRLEEQQRAEAVERKRAESARVKTEEIERKEAQRRAKIYEAVNGASRRGSPTSGSGSKRKRESRSESPEAGGTSTLTREEKRQRKFQNEIRKAELESAANARSRHIRQHLNAAPAASSSSKKSAKKADLLPVDLQPLNLVKRDTRTMDDVQREREGGRVLQGDDARSFNDWFGTQKKSDAAAEKERARIEAQERRRQEQVEKQAKRDSAFAKQRQTDAERAGLPAPPPTHSVVLPPSAFQPQARARAGPTASSSRHGPPAASTSKRPGASKAGSSSTGQRPLKSARPGASSSFKGKGAAPPTKRRRDLDEDHLDSEDEYSDDDQGVNRNMIWKLMSGKTRGEYRDDFEDDDGSDMEAGLEDIELEDMRSTRIAKREDQMALKEQMQYEAEKKRRLGRL
ncbi:hypothetical protein BKA62DRAFT_701823 [Auriculariales sp. MPI-PUGE-AT-0066]|nr:hypothetical protein BKA62DRAFT_701823 [Auriculariales sp. MPI-PUGE-AT-0066]